jgi:predicted nucleotidyltransferase
MPIRLPIDQEALASLRRRHHHQINKLSLFGSTPKGTARPDSDIGLLVEFEPQASRGYMELTQIEIELSEEMGGRKVDLRTAPELSRYFRDEVARAAQVQYEAG